MSVLWSCKELHWRVCWDRVFAYLSHRFEVSPFLILNIAAMNEWRECCKHFRMVNKSFCKKITLLTFVEIKSTASGTKNVIPKKSRNVSICISGFKTLHFHSHFSKQIQKASRLLLINALVIVNVIIIKKLNKTIGRMKNVHLISNWHIFSFIFWYFFTRTFFYSLRDDLIFVKTASFYWVI